MSKVSSLVCIILCIFFSQVCCARQWEVSPLSGYTFGGSFQEEGSDSSLSLKESFSAGIAIDTEYEKDTQLELYYSRQRTGLEADRGTTLSGNTLFDLDVHYLQIGGTYMWSEEKGIVDPYVVGTIGIAHFRPRTMEYDTMTRPSMSLGVGTRIRIAGHLGIRVEARGFATFVNSDAAVFSNSQGLTIHVRSESLTQGVLNAGIYFAF